MLLGYLLATVPPVLLDPLLSSHVAFKARRYPGALWWILPIAALLFASTLMLCVRTSKRRFIIAMLPFVTASLISIPIFRPEMPHGNLVFVCSAWFILGILTVWIHDQPIADPTAYTPLPALNAQIEYIKEQTAIWKAIATGLTAAYLAVLVTLTLALHANNKEVVTAKREIFILNEYSNTQVMLVSVFMLIGPIYESTKKILDTAKLLLLVRLEPSELKTGD